MNQYFYFIFIFQIYMAFRYALKAVMGHVENYSVFKLILVLLLPVIGYYFAVKKEIPVS